MQSYYAEKRLELERGLNFLATLAANAAFIGLLGTVMGIIQSFGLLSAQQGSAMAAVMFVSNVVKMAANGAPPKVAIYSVAFTDIL